MNVADNVAGANYTLGDLPGCGACLRICSVCKKIELRCKSDLLTEEEATYLLGCTKTELARLVRSKKVRVHQSNAKWRYYFRDVRAIVHRIVLAGISVPDTRRGIVNALGEMIELRRREMAELDAVLLQYSIGFTAAPYRYGEVVNDDKPPKDLWYVYHLCYPSGQVFYVGKGIGGRMYQHVKEAQRGGDSHKCRAIRKLLEKGEQINYRVVFITPDEKEAYEYEVLEIDRIGIGKLTNVNAGGLTWQERNRILGMNIPHEQRSFEQFKRILDTYEMTKEERSQALFNWADWRMYKLSCIRYDAELLSHDEAIRKIDAEIDMLSGFTAKQLTFAHLTKYRDRYRSEWYSD